MHKHNKFIKKTPGNYFNWLPICLEAAAELEIPMTAIRLDKVNDKTRILQPASAEDVTQNMEFFATKMHNEFGRADIHGYKFKNKSPSCRKIGIKVWLVPNL